MLHIHSTLMRRSIQAVLTASLAWSSQSAWSQGLEEVIVTAQKREQGLQDVPIAVEAFSAQEITNLSAQDIGDLGTFTPNVSISKASNQPNYAIRGIGTDDFGIGADPAVGVYQDGVYIGRSGGSKVAFNDLARVEILNGPQGTLFGRNAAAGAIQYISNKPDEELYGWARGTVGNYDRYQVDGVANVPLADNLYFRVGMLWNQRDGWIDNVYNANDLARQGNRSIVTQLRWLPTDRLDTILRLEFDQTDEAFILAPAEGGGLSQTFPFPHLNRLNAAGKVRHEPEHFLPAQAASAAHSRAQSRPCPDRLLQRLRDRSRTSRP